jgi:tetratricopeptide (TPR) repeat protein
MQPVQQHAGQGQQVSKEPLRRRISNFLAHTVDRFRIALWVVLIAAAAFLVGYLVYSEVNKRIVYDSTMMAEGAQNLYDTWQAESDATKKAALEKDLVERLGKLIDQYPRHYGGQRGLFLRAELNYGKKAWDAALNDYESLAARFPKGYLAPISLFNAAICYEEKGDKDTAQKLYTRAYGDYKDSTVAARAIFNAGRIDEEKGAWADAQKIYEQMDSLYSQSVWTKLAKNRIVELKVQGRIK